MNNSNKMLYDEGFGCFDHDQIFRLIFFMCENIYQSKKIFIRSFYAYLMHEQIKKEILILYF